MLFWTISRELLSAFGQNLLVFVLTLAMALPLGLVIAFGLMMKFKPVAYLTKLFVWIIRGTPLMLQLYVVMYVPGLVFKIPMQNRLVAVLIAFVINYSCYFAEIYRGGIQSIPQGQYEAGKVLGMTSKDIFFHIVLFQVIKRIVPPLGNEIITLVKDTSLARVVAFAEIILCATEYTARGLIWPLFYTGAFFLIFNGLLTLLLSYVEKKLDYYKG